MLGKELNQLQLIPEIVADDLIAVYDTSDTINAEKLKKITYEDFIEAVVVSVSGVNTFVDMLDTPEGYNDTELLYYTASGIVSSPDLKYAENILSLDGTISGTNGIVLLGPDGIPRFKHNVGEGTSYFGYLHTMPAEATYIKVYEYPYMAFVVDGHGMVQIDDVGLTLDGRLDVSDDIRMTSAGNMLNFGNNTISGTGDVHCNDIYTSSGTVYIGDLKLSTADGETLLINDEAVPHPPFPIRPGTPTTEPGAPGGESLEISVIYELHVNLYPDGAGGAVATISAADLIRVVRCYSGEIPNLLYGLRRDGGTFPPSLHTDPFDAKITLDCSDSPQVGVYVYIQNSNDEIEVYAIVYISDYLAVCP